ncbi:glycosyltransferase [Arthrobacter sp. OAP107]|uniref:glycosyltransferase n=1 Tax=Arthrobacter sp. OAP107 TaxID=3156445 RepID=UPI0033941FC5
MRILQIGGMAGPGPIAGGVWRVAEMQALALADAGHDVTLVGEWLDNQPPSSANRRLLSVRPLFPGAGYRALFAKDLHATLKEFSDVDVAHIHLARDYTSTRSLAFMRKQGVPTVVQTHGMISTPSKAATKAFDSVFKRLYLTAPSKWLALTLAERVALVDYGVDECNVTDVSNAVSRPSRQWTLGPSRLFSFVSRLHPRKQADVFVRAGLEVLSEGGQAEFTVAGPDQGHGGVVRQLIESSSAREKFSLVGPIDHDSVQQLLAETYALVLPSRDEIAPMIVLEACAMGVPVVLTSDCGLAKIVSDYGAGLVVEPDDHSVAKAMKALLKSPDLAQQLSGNARRLFEERWSTPALVGQLECIYAEVSEPSGNSL